MKKLALLLTIMGGIAFSANAQRIETTPQSTADVGSAPIKQGNWMVGGSLANLGYSFEGKAFNVNLQPRAGYFVSDGIAIGAQANLGLTAAKGHDNEWNYGIAPFVRYYFPEGSSSSGRFFGQGDIGIAGSSIGKGASLALGANLGYAHFITRTVALEATVGYNYTKSNVNLGDKASGLGVGLGFQIYLPGQR
ncbi:hypothetical protein ACFX5U_05170 [Sphingobacterium sp. SG20118]|uniref:hypothetical protein n=1 Tax=Sphingobacterium TaxID=28453 RepID=UPI002468E4E5|nr:hypothetical protein [Sphingobacterium faecium]MDH5827472.1 hypothetical protein [Sphingobacterium faecium]